MSTPPTPTEAKALIPSPTASLCGVFVSVLLQLPVAFYNLVKWLVDDSGVGARTMRAGDMIQSFTPLTEDSHRKLCSGQALDKTEFEILFNAIGAVYDTMDGQLAPGGNLFRVPKCNARFALSVGSLPSATAVTLGGVGGEEQHVLTEAEMPSHTHGISASTATLDIDAVSSRVLYGEHDTITNVFTDTKQTTSTGGDDPHNNMPPYYGIYVYICTGK